MLIELIASCFLKKLLRTTFNQREILQDLLSLTADDLILKTLNYLHNIFVVLLKPCLQWKSIGLTCSIVWVFLMPNYQKYLKWIGIQLNGKFFFQLLSFLVKSFVQRFVIAFLNSEGMDYLSLLIAAIHLKIYSRLSCCAIFNWKPAALP